MARTLLRAVTASLFAMVGCFGVFFESLFVASGLEVVVLRCLVFFGFWSGVMSLFFVDFSVFFSLGLLFWDIEVTLYCGRG